MKDFQTIIGVIELKSQGESLGTIQRRYGIGHSTVETCVLLVREQYKDSKTALIKVDIDGIISTSHMRTK